MTINYTITGNTQQENAARLYEILKDHKPLAQNSELKRWTLRPFITVYSSDTNKSAPEVFVSLDVLENGRVCLHGSGEDHEAVRKLLDAHLLNDDNVNGWSNSETAAFYASVTNNKALKAGMMAAIKAGTLQDYIDAYKVPGYTIKNKEINALEIINHIQGL